MEEPSLLNALSGALKKVPGDLSASDVLPTIRRLVHQQCFPTVPDKWLVRRKNGNTNAVEKQWLVDSNYVWDSAAPPQPEQHIAFPVYDLKGKVKYGFRYLGKVTEVSTDGTPSLDGTHLDTHYAQPLSAVGYGDPAFAALYPNCRSVFGMHDATFDPGQNSVYEVVGCYSNQPSEAGASESSPGYPLWCRTQLFDSQSEQNRKQYQSIKTLCVLRRSFDWTILGEKLKLDSDSQRYLTASGWLDDQGNIVPPYSENPFE